MPLIGMVNAHMFGHASEPGEYVDWFAPDYDTVEGWRDLLGMTIEEYAADSPHMIVFEVQS
jgi:hypothetical protein